MTRPLLLLLLLAGLAVAQTAVMGPIPSVVAKMDATAQTANITTSTLYTVPASTGGTYRFSCYVVLTVAATTSSTIPACVPTWTDLDTSTAEAVLSVTSNQAGNTVGLTGIASSYTGSLILQAKAGSAIRYYTGGYASVGGTAMNYAIHIKLEFLGN